MTPRLQLPEIVESQAGKYLTHNEALRILDALCPNLVIQAVENTPPGSPADGECWIVGDAPTDAWTGRDGMIAQRYNGAWYYIQPLIGWAAWNSATSTQLRFNGSAWV